MKAFLLTVLIAVSFFSCIQAQKKLAIIGSSTSACTGPSSYSKCYVGLLEAYYNKVAPQDTSVTSLGIPGTNVYNGMPSSYTPPRPENAYKPITSNNITAALAMNPSVVIVNYPSNEYDNLSIAEIMFCLRTIRDSSTKKNVPCFITTTQPRTSGSFNTSEQKRKMTEIKDSIIKQFGGFAIDFWNGLYNPSDSSILPEYSAGDNIHLNDAGHALLFERVKAKNIFSVAGGALPTSFINQNAIFTRGKALLQWTTTAEKNIDSFTIERSSNSKNFTTIGNQQSNNNSDKTNSYLFEDLQPLNGTNYYRIAIITLNGPIEYSPILKIVVNNKQLAFNNIATSSSLLTIEVESAETLNSEIQLISNNGVLLKQQRQKLNLGTSIITISIENLSTGTYYLRLITDKQHSIIKSFIK